MDVSLSFVKKFSSPMELKINIKIKSIYEDIFRVIGFEAEIWKTPNLALKTNKQTCLQRMNSRWS